MRAKKDTQSVSQLSKASNYATSSYADTSLSAPMKQAMGQARDRPRERRRPCYMVGIFMKITNSFVFNKLVLHVDLDPLIQH